MLVTLKQEKLHMLLGVSAYNLCTFIVIGFLLGLGLQGHLTALSVTDIYDYLTQGHEPTTISILIGVAASK
jgi:hypothetical protein